MRWIKQSQSIQRTPKHTHTRSNENECRKPVKTRQSVITWIENFFFCFSLAIFQFHSMSVVVAQWEPPKAGSKLFMFYVLWNVFALPFSQLFVFISSTSGNSIFSSFLFNEPKRKTCAIPLSIVAMDLNWTNKPKKKRKNKNVNFISHLMVLCARTFISLC